MKDRPPDYPFSLITAQHNSYFPIDASGSGWLQKVALTDIFRILYPSGREFDTQRVANSHNVISPLPYSPGRTTLP